MSPASYRAAPPRGGTDQFSERARRDSKPPSAALSDALNALAFGLLEGELAGGLDGGCDGELCACWLRYWLRTCNACWAAFTACCTCCTLTDEPLVGGGVDDVDEPDGGGDGDV